MKKLKDRSGETLVETLAAILIITLSLAFLSTSLVTASKINQKLQGEDPALTYEDVGSGQTGTVKLDGVVLSKGIVIYEKDGYYFYTMDPIE